jgi:Protein of unknown function (DUF2442)
MVISLENIKYLDEYKLELIFSDQLVRTIDFEPFLKSAKNPMTSKYLDMDNFKKYKLEYGDLVWGDYEMCFPIWDLHQGNI